jgi:hypothetical protein
MCPPLCPPCNSGVAPDVMGADHGHGFDTRSVWSPAGGWYADPRGWRRNTAVAFAAVAAISFCVASVSAKLEVRHAPASARAACGPRARAPRRGGRHASERRRRLRRRRPWRAGMALPLPREKALGLCFAAPAWRLGARCLRGARGVAWRRRTRAAAAAQPARAGSAWRAAAARTGLRRHADKCARALPPQQRPLAPVRPILSQRWCDNFPKEEEKK